jgi:cytoskeletal protein CcmA (bactofilin family)
MSVKRALRFLHRDRKTVVARPAPAAQQIGVLGLDSIVQGGVRFQGSLTLDGSITGDVRAPEGSGAVLVVGQNATVSGDISVDSVLISGRVTGNVKAVERLEIFGTGVLLGDVETGDIMIQGGAEFQGRCHMLKHAPALHDGPEGPASDSGHGPADAGRKGRKGKGGKHDRGEGHGTEDASPIAPDRLAVQQDSRTERGSSSEGTSA